MASSDGDVVFPTEEPRNQAVSGPQDPLHITPTGANPRAFRVSAARLSTGKKSPSRLSSFPPRSRAQSRQFCLSHTLLLRCAGPVSLVSLLCTTAPTPHGQPYRRSDLECYMRAVDDRASPGQCLLSLATSISRWTVATLYHYLELPQPPPPIVITYMICKYVTPSEGSGSESDTMIESGILQQGRTA